MHPMIPMAAAAFTLALSAATLRLAESPRYPVPASPMRGLPALDNSDDTVRDAVMKLDGAEGLAPQLSRAAIVRRFVARIDAIATGAATPAPTALAAIARIDARSAATTYSRLYPLMQQAYEQHSRGEGYFNDRLVMAIDRVLADPSHEAALAHPRLREMRALLAMRPAGG